MERPHLMLLTPLPDPLREALEERFQCHPAESPAERVELSERDPAVRAAVGDGGARFGADEMNRHASLEIISILGVGYDGIDAAACRKRGIRLTHTPDVLTDDVADLALSLVLMCSRRLTQATNYVREGRWLEGPFPLSRSLRGKTAGILGLGRIGAAIAARLEACGMHIAYVSRSPKSTSYRPVDSLTQLAAISDFLVVACPGGEDTRHLVNAEVLHQLGPEGTLINIARGSVVDEEALLRLLEANRLGGVGLDVYADEPRVPAALQNHPRAVLLPHIGSATRETRQAMADLVLANLDAHLEGRNLPTPVV